MQRRLADFGFRHDWRGQVGHFQDQEERFIRHRWAPEFMNESFKSMAVTLSKEHLTQGLRGVQESLTERELERFALVPKFVTGPLDSKAVTINYYKLRY